MIRWRKLNRFITAHAYFGLFPTSTEQQARDAAQRAPYAWGYLLFPIIGILPFYESTREQ